MKTVVLLVVAIGQAAATCAQLKGVSNSFGAAGGCGSAFDESNRAKDIHLRRVTLYYDGGCLAGLKAEYAGKGGDKSTLYGHAKGEEKSMGLGWSEYIKDADVKSGKCIEGLKLTTTTGQSVSVGGAGTPLTKVLSEAHVFGFKGTAGNGCGVSSLAFIWAVEDCNPQPQAEAVAKPAPAPAVQYVDRPVPVPVPVEKVVEKVIEKPVDRVVEKVVTVEKPVTVEKVVYVDRQVEVPVPVPTPVPTPVATKTITIGHPFMKGGKGL